MIRFLADEDFDGRIVRGLLRHLPDLDIVRVQDVGLQSAADAEILAFAAGENRVVLTHDVTTMSAFAYRRTNEGLSMSGVFEIAQELPVGLAIEELILIAECSLENEWQGQIFASEIGALYYQTVASKNI